MPSPSPTLALIESNALFGPGGHFLHVSLVRALKAQGINDIYVIVDVPDEKEINRLKDVIPQLDREFNVNVISPCDIAWPAVTEKESMDLLKAIRGKADSVPSSQDFCEFVRGLKEKGGCFKNHIVQNQNTYPVMAEKAFRYQVDTVDLGVTFRETLNKSQGKEYLPEDCVLRSRISKECAREMLTDNSNSLSQAFLWKVVSPKKPVWTQNTVFITQNTHNEFDKEAPSIAPDATITSVIHFDPQMRFEQLKNKLDAHQNRVLEGYYVEELCKLSVFSENPKIQPLIDTISQLKIKTDPQKTKGNTAYTENMVNLINALAYTNRLLTGDGRCVELDEKGLVKRLDAEGITHQEYQNLANQFIGHPCNGLRAIGLGMLILSISLIPAAGVTMGISLAITAVAGIGLFGVNCRRGLSKAMYEAANENSAKV